MEKLKEEMELDMQEKMEAIKAEILKEEYVSVTYQFLKQGHWKQKTEIIESKDLEKYESKYRVLYITTVHAHNAMMVKLKKGVK
jgi:hypothetical protein